MCLSTTCRRIVPCVASLSIPLSLTSLSVSGSQSGYTSPLLGNEVRLDNTPTRLPRRVSQAAFEAN